MIRCGVYVRQSDAPGDDELAISRQWDEILQKICTPNGWEPVRYADNDRTAVGAKRKRPAYDQMLKDIEAGELQAVAAWDLDRLYREPIDLEYLIPLANRMNLALATVTGDVDLSTDNGRMFARIKGAVAKGETERRAARQRAKGRQMADAGEMWGSRRSFGYNRDGSQVETEAVALAGAYELVLSGHHNLIAICRMWNDAGIRTSLGNTWKSQTQLSKVLLNPRNKGTRTYNGEEIRDGKWERIVEPDVWQAVHDILTDPSRTTAPPAGRKYLLVGIALCGQCAARGVESTMDTTLAGKWTKAGKPGRTSYRCRTCFGVTRDQARSDELITEIVVQRLSRPDAADLLIDQKRPDLAAMRAEAAALRERLESLALDFADGELTKVQLKVATARVKSKLQAAEAAMEDANKARLFKGIVGKDAPKFRDLHLDRRRAVINGLMTITFQKASRRGVFDQKDIVVEPKGGLAAV